MGTAIGQELLELVRVELVRVVVPVAVDRCISATRKECSYFTVRMADNDSADTPLLTKEPEDGDLQSDELPQKSPACEQEAQESSDEEDEEDTLERLERPEYYSKPVPKRTGRAISWVWEFLDELTHFHNHKTPKGVHKPGAAHRCAVELQKGGVCGDLITLQPTPSSKQRR